MDKYTYVFDERSYRYEKNFDINLVILTCQQTYYNHRLQACGYIFLNDVLGDLGLERILVGQFVGWVYSDEGGIDFGVHVDDSNGENPKITLNFNVEGVILDKIDWKA